MCPLMAFLLIFSWFYCMHVSQRSFLGVECNSGACPPSICGPGFHSQYHKNKTMWGCSVSRILPKMFKFPGSIHSSAYWHTSIIQRLGGRIHSQSFWLHSHVEASLECKRIKCCLKKQKKTKWSETKQERMGVQRKYILKLQHVLYRNLNILKNFPAPVKISLQKKS